MNSILMQAYIYDSLQWLQDNWVAVPMRFKSKFNNIYGILLHPYYARFTGNLVMLDYNGNIHSKTESYYNEELKIKTKKELNMSYFNQFSQHELNMIVDKINLIKNKTICSNL